MTSSPPGRTWGAATLADAAASSSPNSWGRPSVRPPSGCRLALALDGGQVLRHGDGRGAPVVRLTLAETDLTAAGRSLHRTLPNLDQPGASSASRRGRGSRRRPSRPRPRRSLRTPRRRPPCTLIGWISSAATGTRTCRRKPACAVLTQTLGSLVVAVATTKPASEALQSMTRMLPRSGLDQQEPTALGSPCLGNTEGRRPAAPRTTATAMTAVTATVSTPFAARSRTRRCSRSWFSIGLNGVRDGSILMRRSPCRSGSCDGERSPGPHQPLLGRVLELRRPPRLHPPGSGPYTVRVRATSRSVQTQSCTLVPMRTPGWRPLAGLLATAGVSHFVVPHVYDRIVPRTLGDPRPWTLASGVAELACAVGLAIPRTSGRSGWRLQAVVVVERAGLHMSSWLIVRRRSVDNHND